MDTVCVVSMGYNDIKIYQGVFENEELAKEYLISKGCKVKKYNDSKGNLLHEAITLTEEFADQMYKENEEVSFYSVVGSPIEDGWNFNLDTIEINKFVRGYDDD